MQYIISSRGRPIGATQLEFARLPIAPEPGFVHPLDATRSGWFHPNSLGETLMPTVALQHSAVRAFVCRNLRDADGRSILQPGFRSSSQFADLAEAFHRVAAMELTLHHADGRLIPTVQVGLQDTEELRELGRSYALRAELDPTIDDAELEWDPEIELAMVDDLELPAGGWHPTDEAEADLDLDEIIARAYEKLADLPRYQVHVELVDASMIP